jgi:hypothetical protein
MALEITSRNLLMYAALIAEPIYLSSNTGKKELLGICTLKKKLNYAIEVRYINYKFKLVIPP